MKLALPCIALVVLLALSLTAHAVPGDIYFSDYQNGTISNNYHNSGIATYQGDYIVLGGSGAMYNLTNQTFTTGVLNISFVINDTGTSFSPGSFNAITFGDDHSSGIGSGTTKVGLSTGFGNVNTTKYMAQSSDGAIPVDAIGPRTNGAHKVTILMNVSAHTAGYYLDGVLGTTETMSTGNYNGLTIEGNVVFPYSYANITVCDTFCGPPPPPPCNSNWTCNSFSACMPNNTTTCLGVTDQNMCNVTFGGNLSSYNGSCSYVPPANGGNTVVIQVGIALFLVLGILGVLVSSLITDDSTRRTFLYLLAAVLLLVLLGTLIGSGLL
jgi:hypothetical protein